MDDQILIPIAVIYLGIILLLFVYSSNYFYLVWLSWRDSDPETPDPAPGDWPKVTVQLPIYNEYYVARRLIQAAADLDYPADRLQIQVLDDSIDDTAAIVADCVARLQAGGVNIEHVRRANRSGYKAGALAEGMRQADGEFLALFDADFIPDPGFLRRALPHFQDPKIAFVQTRWGHTNPRYSLLTAVQAISLDAHFRIDQYARSRAGFWFNFNGTGGIWRKEAIQDAGGWTADTLTEDLDLSYRAFMRDWKGAYLDHVVVPAELPVSFSAFRRQQHRWARGSFECALKLLPGIWRKPIPALKKVEATLHLTGNFVYVLLFLLMLSYPFALLISARFADQINHLGLVPGIILNICALAPTCYFISGQYHLRKPWWRSLPTILFMTFFMAGMMLNTTRAAIQAVLRSRAVFERTPKFAISERTDNWLRNRYQLALDPIVFLEIGLAILSLGTVSAAIALSNWIIAFYAGIFCIGLFVTSVMTMAQALSSIRQGRSRGAGHRKPGPDD